jgi:hypothetical protein
VANKQDHHRGGRIEENITKPCQRARISGAANAAVMAAHAIVLPHELDLHDFCGDLTAYSCRFVFLVSRTMFVYSKYKNMDHRR